MSVSDRTVTYDLASAFDPAKSILFFNVTTEGNRPSNGQVGGQLVNSGSQVRFQRSALASGATVHIAWSVVQLDGILVQRGTEDAPAGTLATSAILSPPVDLTRSFPLFSFHLQGNNYNDNDWREAFFVDDQTLRFERGQANDPGEIDWQVVEFLPASGGVVQTGGLALANDELNAAIPIVHATDPSHAFLIFSYQLDGPGVLASQLVSGRIDSASQLFFERSSNNIGITATWYLVEWDAMTVQRGSLSYTGSQQNQSATLGQAVDQNRSVCFCPSYQRQGMTDEVGNHVGSGWVTTRITNGGSEISAYRGIAQGNARFDWTVVEWE